MKSTQSSTTMSDLLSLAAFLLADTNQHRLTLKHSLPQLNGTRYTQNV